MSVNAVVATKNTEEQWGLGSLPQGKSGAKHQHIITAQQPAAKIARYGHTVGGGEASPAVLWLYWNVNDFTVE